MATIEDVFEQLEKDIQKSINESISHTGFICSCSPTSSISFLFTSNLKQTLEKNITYGVNHFVENHNQQIFHKAKVKSYAVQKTDTTYDLSLNQEEDPPFKIVDGIPEPPEFKYDNGFLDKFKMRKPTYKDKLKYDYWKTKAATARLLREDLDDALDAYEHFLGNTGTPFEFDLGEYIQEDTKGADLLSDAINLTKSSVRKLIKKSGTYTISSSGFHANYANSLYPETENWQKAIGAFNYWISATIVTIEKNGLITYQVAMTIHAEDKYNFNPGMKDIATGTPDSANGIFEITGLAKQFIQYGSHTVKIQWSEPASKN